ncbi:hypothetical protein [Nocardia wallacei]|uniref:Uncharacterized protein n=1 Tax=Nocardia wallacei TaxID=480035 RepID=A0A7G1KUE0_9NOCA|nr:hypothetical protein [Nocardia wallacei]BCK58531.1 hypothetical protein NWFMUON74_63030 [Nocardia wallacei]
MSNPQQYQQAYESGLASTRSALERFLKEDGTNVFDKKIWSDKTKATGQDVNSLLDTGAPGLQWFERALIRYHRCGDVGLEGFGEFAIPPLDMGEGNIAAETIKTRAEPMEEIRRLEFRWYDQQRSMNLTSLRALSAQLQAASTGTGTQTSTADITRQLNGVAQAVPEHWQGQSGSATQDHLAGFHAHADQQSQYLQAVTAALSGLPEVLLQIVSDKANFIAGFDSEQLPVAGHAMRLGDEDPVSTIITVAARQGTAHSLRADREVAESQFHLGIYANEAGADDAVTDACKKWLTDHFRPAVQEAFKAFVHQCALADYYIRQAYKPVITLLDSHDTTPFPTPGQPGPSTPGPSTPGPSTPGPSTPGPSTPGPSTTDPSTTPDPTTPTSATPDLSSVISGLGQLSGVVQSLGDLATQGISSLSGVVQQGVDGVLALQDVAQQVPSDPAADDPTAGPHQSAEFDLAGKHLKFEMGPNGELQVVTTDGDGQHATYELRLDEQGRPIIAVDDRSPDAPTGESPAQGDQPPGGRHGDGQTADQPPQGLRPPQHPSPGPQHTGDQPPKATGEQNAQHSPPPAQEPPPPTMAPPSYRPVGNQSGPPVTAPAQPIDSGAELSEAGPL